MKENELSMKIIHPYAAGIDIGSKTHWVAVDQVPGNVREFGVYTDLFQIPGVSHSTVLCLLCNMGNDIKRFSSAKRFASWLRLVPNNKMSGGRLISSKTPKGKNAIALSLRPA